MEAPTNDRGLKRKVEEGETPAEANSDDLDRMNDLHSVPFVSNHATNGSTGDATPSEPKKRRTGFFPN